MSLYEILKITLHSDRVFGQNLLRGNIESDCPQVDNFDFINAGDDEEQTRTNSASLASAMTDDLLLFDNICLFTFFSLPSLKMMALSYSGTIRMQKKMEMGKVMTIKMMEMVFRIKEQQSKESSSGSLRSLSFILTTLRENQIILWSKITIAFCIVYLVLRRHFRCVFLMSEKLFCIILL